MDTLGDGGWVEFAAVLLGAAGIIASLALGRHNHYALPDGTIMVRPLPCRVIFWGIIWLALRTILLEPILQTLPFPFIAPGLDLAFFLAFVAILIKELATCFQSTWDWRTGMRQIIFFVFPSLYFDLVRRDLTVFPKSLWFLAAVEMVILLPFLLGFGSRGYSAAHNAEEPPNKTSS